jgi:hypothetical protein
VQRPTGRIAQFWVTINGITQPIDQWRYGIHDSDPARFGSLKANKPFTYQAIHAELIHNGLSVETIPPEFYFWPTADEREEGVNMIFREVPVRMGFRK